MTNFCVLFYICIWKSSSWAVTEGCAQYRISALPETLAFGCKSNTLSTLCILAFTLHFRPSCEAVTSYIPPLSLLYAHQKPACLSLRAMTILLRLRPSIPAPLPARGPPSCRKWPPDFLGERQKAVLTCWSSLNPCGPDQGLVVMVTSFSQEHRGGQRSDRHGLQQLRPHLLKLCLSLNF